MFSPPFYPGPPVNAADPRMSSTAAIQQMFSPMNEKPAAENADFSKAGFLLPKCPLSFPPQYDKIMGRAPGRSVRVRRQDRKKTAFMYNGRKCRKQRSCTTTGMQEAASLIRKYHLTDYTECVSWQRTLKTEKRCSFLC